ncbi:hypothetical protein pEaSNUABM54_00125 [Erwinia phage pEa_SNUABM_54]|nr:hypothetical protein pEaSNUABM54_00125 [Erwinia phage pEa_SNUABM_54]
MEKLIRDGKVAVVFSPGHSGSYVYDHQLPPDACFNVKVIKVVLGESRTSLEKTLKKEFPDATFYSPPELEVEWIDVGREFFIREYESAESIIYKDTVPWITA